MENQKCPKCGAELINKVKVDGRTLFHCYCGEYYEDSTFDPVKW